MTADQRLYSVTAAVVREYIRIQIMARCEHEAERLFYQMANGKLREGEMFGQVKVTANE